MPKYFRAVAVLLLAFALIARGDITANPPPDKKKGEKHELPPPPPHGVPVEVKVTRGGSADIVLRAANAGLFPVKFLVRAQPQSGKLSEIQPKTADSAVVTYSHNGSAAGVRDQFLFAVQTERGVSVAAEVNVTIVEEPPKLGVVGELNFGTLRVGDKAVQEITVENRGEFPARGALAADSPWIIDGDANFAIEPGAAQKFTLVFAPAGEDEFHGVVRYGAAVQTTSLLGRAVAPLTVQPARVNLAMNGVVRSGSFTLANRTHEPQTVLFRTDVRLHTPKSIELAADGEAPVNIEATSVEHGAFDDEVLVELGNFATKVSVHAAPFGALLRATPQSLAFGRLVMNQTAVRAVRIENIGGAPVQMAAGISAPFRIADTAITLRAGEWKDVRLSVDTATVGAFKAVLLVKSQGGSVVLPVEAEVVSEFVPALAEAAPQASSPAASSQPDQQAAPADTPRVLHLSKKKISPLQVTRITKKDCDIAWQGPDDGQFKVEERWALLDDKHQVKTKWVDATDTKLGVTGKPGARSFTAHFSKLTPSRTYFVRALLLDAKGEVMEASAPLVFTTSPESGFLPSPITIFAVALFVAVALLFRRWRKNKP